MALGDEEGFDARAYDENGNGDVGWSEFVQVFKQRSFSIKLSMPERIFLTFDNPDCSYAAQLISTLVLATIVASSVCFILSTAPEFQKPPVGLKKPEPKDAFAIVENVCLSIFFFEYIVRLFTCWAVRSEVADKDKLLRLCLEYGPLHLSTRTARCVRYVLNPANIIDLVAIVPGVLGWIIKIVSPDSEGLEGGGFVVLRLVRLTRMLRTPKLAEPAFVIARTLSVSTKALYLLAFNAVLGILVFGSLMYLVEKGDWDWETRTFNRYVGREWNATSGDWQSLTEQSPFLSIPHTFWWAIVTSTTVGYGAIFYPTTTWGYVVATTSMVFSVVIGALPVGVIGGNFSQVWQDYANEKEKHAIKTEKDKRFITNAIQRIDPQDLSNLIYIEVWNERFPEEKQYANSGQDRSTRPDVAEFIGQAHTVMNLPKEDSKCITRTLKLHEGAEGKLFKRKVTGHIQVTYEWASLASSLDEDGETAPLDGNGGMPPGLRGKLKVSVLHADNLMNLTYQNGKRAGSNPYCRVFVYPHSPKDGRTVCPSAWRMPLDIGTLSPKWNASHVFNFNWVPLKEGLSMECTTANSKVQESSNTGSAGTFAKSVLSKKGGVSTMLQGLGQDLKCLSDELRALNERATRSSLTPEPPAERMD